MCTLCNPLDLRCLNCDSGTLCLTCALNSEPDPATPKSCKCLFGSYKSSTGGCELCVGCSKCQDITATCYPEPTHAVYKFGASILGESSVTITLTADYIDDASL